MYDETKEELWKEYARTLRERRRYAIPVRLMYVCLGLAFGILIFVSVTKFYSP